MCEQNVLVVRIRVVEDYKNDTGSSNSVPAEEYWESWVVG